MGTAAPKETHAQEWQYPEYSFFDKRLFKKHLDGLELLNTKKILLSYFKNWRSEAINFQERNDETAVISAWIRGLIKLGYQFSNSL